MSNYDLNLYFQNQSYKLRRLEIINTGVSIHYEFTLYLHHDSRLDCTSVLNQAIRIGVMSDKTQQFFHGTIKQFSQSKKHIKLIGQSPLSAFQKIASQTFHHQALSQTLKVCAEQVGVNIHFKLNADPIVPFVNQDHESYLQLLERLCRKHQLLYQLKQDARNFQLVVTDQHQASNKLIQIDPHLIKNVIYKHSLHEIKNPTPFVLKQFMRFTAIDSPLISGDLFHWDHQTWRVISLDVFADIDATSCTYQTHGIAIQASDKLIYQPVKFDRPTMTTGRVKGILNTLGNYPVALRHESNNAKQHDFYFPNCHHLLGDDRGFSFPWQKESKVIVAYLNNDPDSVFIIGGLSTPSMPSLVKQSNCYQHCLYSQGGSKLLFDDDPTQPQIKLSSKDDAQTVSLSRAGIHLSNQTGDLFFNCDHHIKAQAKQSIQWKVDASYRLFAKKNYQLNSLHTQVQSAKSLNLSIADHIQLNAEQNISLKAKQLMQQASDTLQLRSKDNLTTHSQTLSLTTEQFIQEGSPIKIHNAAGVSIVINSDTIELNATEIQVISQQQQHHSQRYQTG